MMAPAWLSGVKGKLGVGLRSLKVRVFVAVVAVALLPVATFVGWGLLLQYDDLQAQTAEIASRNAGVHATWDRLDSDETAGMMRSLASMQATLPRSSYEGLLGRVATLMDSSHGSYVIVRTEPRRLTAEYGPFSSSPEALRQLRADGFWWGDATYHYDPYVEYVDATSHPTGSTFPTMGEDTPLVAWMPAAGVVWYVHVTSGYENPPQGVPAWWIVAVIGVMVAIIAGSGALATLLATRDVARPLKRMRQESERLVKAGVVEPVPVRGPSEVQRAATAFNTMATRLSAAQETEQQFLLSVSHELKTPLTSLKGYGEALAEGAVPAHEAGLVVAEEAGRMQRLVQDLLDLGRVRKSTFGVRHEVVDLAQVVREATRRFAACAEDCRIELTAAVAAEDTASTGASPMALADSDRLLQVVSNLVENAVRCAPAFSRVTVSIGTDDPERCGRDQVYVRVADSGLGLQAEELQHAFDRFYLYERYGRERPVGSGLGLAIVKELSIAMGGDVSVTSRPGEGTTFTIVLPRARG